MTRAMAACPGLRHRLHRAQNPAGLTRWIRSPKPALRVGHAARRAPSDRGRGERRECYVCSMSEIAARELRNHTADVLRRVQAGEQVTITSRGRPVAELTPVRAVRRRPIARAELAMRLGRAQADPGLRQDLAALAGETTDDLDPIR